MAYFVKDPTGWRRFTNTPREGFGKYMMDAGRELQARAKAQVGKRTLDLMTSINVKGSFKGDGPEIMVGSSVPHALVHHEGARPHKIYPVRAKALRFPQGNKIRYAASVNHPGHEPNKYLTDNLPHVI